MAAHVRGLLAFMSQGRHVFDYGNNLRAALQGRRRQNAFDYPGFVPAYIRPLFCEGSGPFRWVAAAVTRMISASRIRRADGPLSREDAHDPLARRWRASASSSKGSLPASVGSATASDTASGSLFNARKRPHGQGQGADRDRSGSPRLRLRGEPKP